MRRHLQLCLGDPLAPVSAPLSEASGRPGTMLGATVPSEKGLVLAHQHGHIRDRGRVLPCRGEQREVAKAMEPQRRKVLPHSCRPRTHTYSTCPQVFNGRPCRPHCPSNPSPHHCLHYYCLRAAFSFAWATPTHPPASYLVPTHPFSQLMHS